eukprot:448557-Hanusia_phi.AAC.1
MKNLCRRLGVSKWPYSRTRNNDEQNYSRDANTTDSSSSSSSIQSPVDRPILMVDQPDFGMLEVHCVMDDDIFQGEPDTRCLMGCSQADLDWSSQTELDWIDWYVTKSDES